MLHFRLYDGPVPTNRGRRWPSVRGVSYGVALAGALSLLACLVNAQLTAPEPSARTPLEARAARVHAAPSLLDNGAFHYGLRGWQAGGTGAGRLALQADGRGGSRAATVTARRRGVVALWNTTSNSAIDLVRRDRVTVSAWVRTNQSGRTAVLTARTSAGTRHVQTWKHATPLGSTGWHQVSRTFTVSRGATNLLVQVKVPSLAAGRRVVIDDVSVRDGAVHRLFSAGFDRVRAGRIRPVDFISSIGGRDTIRSAYDDTFVVRDSRGTGQVLRTRLEANTIHSEPSGNHGIVTFVPLGRRVERGCISYQVRFDSHFDWSMGGKLPGLEGVRPGVSPGYPTGGRRPGSNGWSGRMMWLSPQATRRVTGSNTALSYMYGPTQQSNYGDSLLWGRGFVAGRWHDVMQCYRMNTPGRADGVLRGWFDGTLVLNQPHFVYRTRRDVAINHLAWSIFRGGNDMAWASPRTGYVDIDNLKVTGR